MGCQEFAGHQLLNEMEEEIICLQAIIVGLVQVVILVEDCNKVGGWLQILWLDKKELQGQKPLSVISSTCLSAILMHEGMSVSSDKEVMLVLVVSPDLPSQAPLSGM